MKHNRWWISIIITILLVGGSFASWQWLSDANRFPIQHVEVHSTFNYINRIDLQAIIEPYTAASFFAIDVHTLQTKLLEIPWIAQARILRLWPGTLSITLIEREPIAYWNKTGFISRQQEVFYPHPLPVISGLAFLAGPESTGGRVLQQFQSMNKIVSSLGLAVKSLEWLKSGDWQARLNNGMTLMLGPEVNPSLKRFAVIYPAIFDNADNKIAEQIDLRYSNGIAVKWK